MTSPRYRRGSFAAFVARRLAWTAVVAWFVITATFLMLALIPGDPIEVLLPHGTADERSALRERYCLDDGVVVQYGCFVRGAVHGDLGDSYETKEPVTKILADHAWPTAQLALAAIVVQLAIGVPLGVIAARRRGRWPDVASGIAGLLALSAPAFFVGSVLLYVLAFALDWFPLGGYGGPGVLDRLSHLALPAVTLAAGGIAYYARVVRSEMIDVLGADYVRTARAKGLPERTVIGRHALRNALGPLVAVVGVDLGVLLGGAVVTESIFGWPGLGRETLLAVRGLDVPVIIGVVLAAAIAIALANLVADIVHAWLDPRLR